MFSRYFAAAVLIALPVGVSAQSIQIETAWARAASPNAKAGGAFMTLTDTGAPDKLGSATSPVAGRGELHRSVEENGLIKMLPVEALDLELGKKVRLTPGSYHIMLMDLGRQLKPSDTFPKTLSFAKAVQMTVMVTVEAAGATAPVVGGHSTSDIVRISKL